MVPALPRVKPTCVCLVFIAGKLHEIGLDKVVEVAVHDGVDIGCLVPGAVVLDAAVIDYVRAMMAAAVEFPLAGFNLGLLLHTVLQLFVV